MAASYNNARALTRGPVAAAAASENFRKRIFTVHAAKAAKRGITSKGKIRIKKEE
jgi:hypothetical protein